MATLIGDYGPAHSAGFHTMIATQGLPYSQQHAHAHQDSPHYRSDSHSRDSTPRRPSSTSRYTTKGQKDWDPAAGAAEGGGASRLPSPPDSSSPSGSAGSASQSVVNLETKPQAASQYGQKPASMDPSAQPPAQGSTPAPSASSFSSATHVNPAIPSPASDSGGTWSSTATPVDHSLAATPTATQQTTIHVRDLAHIHSLAKTEMNAPGVNDPPLEAMKYEISGMPIGDIIEMVAALLTKITTTNDLQHDALSRNAIERNASHVKQAQAQNDGSATEHSMSPLSSSVLAFHGKNVPAITILSYLSRIHKYCPTTYEVFLSLLVYFDRMTERVNAMVIKDEEAKRAGQPLEPTGQSDVVMKDDNAEDAASDDSDEVDEDIADDESDSEVERDTPARSASGMEDAGRPSAGSNGKTPTPPSAPVVSSPAPAVSQPTFFVVDSFNIHRLIIAGVTCASKFFSDVFYTNSRYAKVRFPAILHLAPNAPFPPCRDMPPGCFSHPLFDGQILIPHRSVVSPWQSSTISRFSSSS